MATSLSATSIPQSTSSYTSHSLSPSPTISGLIAVGQNPPPTFYACASIIQSPGAGWVVAEPISPGSLNQWRNCCGDATIWWYNETCQATCQAIEQDVSKLSVCLNQAPLKVVNGSSVNSTAPAGPTITGTMNGTSPISTSVQTGTSPTTSVATGAASANKSTSLVSLMTAGVLFIGVIFGSVLV